MPGLPTAYILEHETKFVKFVSKKLCAFLTKWGQLCIFLPNCASTSLKCCIFALNLSLLIIIHLLSKNYRNVKHAKIFVYYKQILKPCFIQDVVLIFKSKTYILNLAAKKSIYPPKTSTVDIFFSYIYQSPNALKLILLFL